MTPSLSPFAGLTNVTFQLITTCNLSCDYCFQDACNVSSSPQGGQQRIVNPLDTAGILMNLVRLSREDLIMVFSGGEPMLVPVDWYETFFREMDRCLEGSDRKVEYSVQTNISILKPEIIDLFRKHEVHFSVHYDGELDDPKLLSKKRKENIIALRENGLAVTVLVVGTVESLKALPASIEFFNSQGIRFYRVNYVSSQGRGGRVSLIPPELRAEAEFEAAFLASQFDFNTRDNVVMNKFLHYYNNVICGSPYSTAPRPQDCMAGVRSAYVAADGLIYPCSFFPGITGPMVRAKDLPSGNMEEAAAAVAMCKRSNAYYDERCPSCQALPICGEYCPLSPVTATNFMESFCSAQVTLRRMMDRNRDLSELVAGRFIELKRSYPGDVPRSCGTRTT